MGLYLFLFPQMMINPSLFKQSILLQNNKLELSQRFGLNPSGTRSPRHRGANQFVFDRITGWTRFFVHEITLYFSTNCRAGIVIDLPAVVMRICKRRDAKWGWNLDPAHRFATILYKVDSRVDVANTVAKKNDIRLRLLTVFINLYPSERSVVKKYTVFVESV